MSVQPFGRSQRVSLNDSHRGEILLQSPPALPRGTGQGAQQLMFMLPMMLGMGAMSFVYIGRSGGVGTWVFGALYASAMAGMVVMSLSRGGASKKAQINDERRDYLRYLGGLRTQVREVAARQRDTMRYAMPDPGDLWALAGTARMWQRRRGDPEFAQVRVGTGPQRLATPLRAPQTAPLEDLDPVASTSLRYFIRTYATVADLPVAVSLRGFARITISGPRPEAVDLARAVLAQLVTAHSPQDLRVACCLGIEQRDDWEWIKWLPHAVDPNRVDAAGPVRLCAGSLGELVDLLGPDLGDRPPYAKNSAPDPELPHLVIVVDGGDTKAQPLLDLDTGRLGVTVIDIDGRSAAASPDVLDLIVQDGRLGMRAVEGLALVGDADGLCAAGAEVVARQLTSLYAGGPIRETALSGTFGLLELLGIGDPRRIDPAVTWREWPTRGRLRLPIGVDPAGHPIELDLKESAEGGMGPHGLVIGATGSGKSELLRTLVTGLALTHSSETLNFALIDFKGGATFAGMADLPHTSAVITNLAAELTLVDRMGDALRGELVRRQELLRAAGNFASARDYERAREAGAALRPLPSLLVIIDEFSELLSTRPEFIDLFVMIGRLGRSLGIHLMLASQRLEEGRLRGLDSHLSYRVGLRTFSASESRAVLGVPDAYELPAMPGSAFLKTDTNTLIRFKAAYVSGELPQTRPDVSTSSPFNRHAVPYTLGPVSITEDRSPMPGSDQSLVRLTYTGNRADELSQRTDDPVQLPGAAETIMGAIIRQIGGHGPAAHQIWLPPLDEPSTLDQILPALSVNDTRGLCADGWTGNGRLTVPVAIVDKPFEQRRDVLWADLSGAAGHSVVVGAPQSGKSTLLRTLVATLALTHTPREAQFFLLDFGGGALSGLAALPHVSGCASRLDPERCRRIVAELTGLLAERERLFQSLGIESVVAFRHRPPPAADGRRFGDVFLVVDGWMTLRQEFEQLEESVTALASRGLGFGIHVMLSVNRWMELRPAMRDMIGTQFELKLGDPSDSSIDRRSAGAVPQGEPGRGLTRERLHFLVALPRVDGRQSADDLSEGVSDLVKGIDAGWRGERAPQVRLLPRLVRQEDLPAPVEGDRRVPLGLAEADLGPVFVDFDADPHFMAFGDSESGKTGLLRLLAQGIVSRYSAAEAALIVVDYRRGLLDAVPPPNLLEYAGSEPVIDRVMGEVVQGMRGRLPGPDVTAEQLRERSWWTGPDLFVLVDDYDLVVSQARNPLAPLLEFLPQARDIGLHLVVVRRSGGAARALFEPVLQRLRDLSTPGLIMSGSRDEGVLLGDVKASAKPPGCGDLIVRRARVDLVQVAWVP
jgi:S-DNA-T family DNA segregation ATPase FtsK/SpoIIIE